MELTSDESKKNRIRKHARTYILIALILAIGIAGVWLLFNDRLVSSSLSETKTALVIFPQSSTQSTATLKTTSTLLPVKTFTPIFPTSTVTLPAPSPTSTLTMPPPHMLETPFGFVRKFLIHRTLEGESLISMAATYNTSVDAIRAVNYAQGETVWVDVVLVIPLGQTDVGGVPPMRVISVSVDGVAIEALALEQNVDAVILRELNAFPEGYILHRGEWVLIPQETTTP